MCIILQPELSVALRRQLHVVLGGQEILVLMLGGQGYLILARIADWCSCWVGRATWHSILGGQGYLAQHPGWAGLPDSYTHNRLVLLLITVLLTCRLQCI
jgi:hypothetical protein